MLKLNFRGKEFHAIRWEERVGFLNTEIYKVLNLPYKEYITRYCKNSDDIEEGIDYEILQGSRGFKFKNQLKSKGINFRFSKILFIYDTGLVKLLDNFNDEEREGFKEYLKENNICYFDGKNVQEKLQIFSSDYSQYIVKYKGFDCRVLELDGEKWVVGVDICNILNLNGSLIDKIPFENKRVVDAILKSNANNKLRVINIQGIYTLLEYSNNDDIRDFEKWTERIFSRVEIEEKGEQMKIDLSKDTNKEKETTEFSKNIYKKQQEEKDLSRAYDTIEVIGNMSIPDNIKVEIISSILAKEVL